MIQLQAEETEHPTLKSQENLMIRSHKLDLVAAAALLLGCPLAAAEVHVLAEGDFRVEIEVAGERLGHEFGPRFDRTAVVRSITVDGLELLGPWGLPDEFGLYGNGVLGYETAEVGDTFIKIGVAQLVRDTEAGYHFAHPYPVDRLFPVTVSATEESLTVFQQSDGEGPWQYEYTKSYQLTGDKGLRIDYQLSNRGTKPWTFEHYNHHWFRVDGVPVGTGYRVVTGFELPAAETGLLRGPFSLEMPGPLTPGAAHYYASDLTEVPASANTFELEIEGHPVVRYQGSFPPQRFALYAAADGFCPEVFTRAALGPDETVRWSSTYRFEDPRASANQD